MENTAFTLMLFKQLKKYIGSVFFLAALLAFGQPAWAGSILSLPVNGGTLERQGGRGSGGTFSGSGIGISQLSDGAETLPIVMGTLTFDIDPSRGGSLVSGAGSQFVVDGCINLNGSCQSEGTTALLTGSVVGVKLVREHGETILMMTLLEQINPELAALLHISDTTSEGELELVLAGSGKNRRQIVGGELTAFATISEPSSFMLLAAGLTALMIGLGHIFFPSLPRIGRKIVAR
ncbi:MAG TPA: hypothetical protein VND65_16485 [Candidatus Binatia bacterium]|nr:hypothetical protein [Candidatus Binatia bacterium]